MSKAILNMEMQIEAKEEYKEVSFIRNPIIVLSTTAILIYEELQKLCNLLFKNKPILLLLILIILSAFIKGPHTSFVQDNTKILYFCVYWISLGIASSIGLGTGLHTFVLYLGPHIAKVTLAATDCTYFPKMYPSKWEFKEFLPCEKLSKNQEDSVHFMTVFLNVILEAFLWGAGTAIGELPPYYMAKAAAEAGKSNEDINELHQLEKQENKFLIDKIKSFLYRHLKKHGFITVLLCASIPNPLFDLAGITCGHFGIGFATFFGATFIGKACFKATIQTVFVILTFSKYQIESVLKVIQNTLPFLEDTLLNSLEKQKKLLWRSDKENMAEESKPLIATLWEIFISAMILYFLKSIIETLVNEKRRKEHDSDIKNQ